MVEASTQTQVLYGVGSACLSIDALAATIERPRYKIAKALHRLINRGLIERREEGCFTATAAGQAFIAGGAEIPNGAPTAEAACRKPVRGTLRQRAWQAMRVQSCSFTIRKIAMLAARDEVNAEQDLHKWYRALEAAGYLQRQPRREAGTATTSNGLLRFTLLRNTGNIAPVHSIKYGCIRDPNTGEDTPCTK
ncbi:hypothetical protein GCM10010873_16290 [Cypionkella aquatica]|uniref:Uncharacterized protein n=1 Tax=Cypionkella aquatica TaxID=1756042 RepID=A0AA37TVN8_9RHOB|nr:hypothetical protein [Cypionkella aquatica]GLS86655.1 hypothetical protein GCM10010873_16290 [Cypionkella aquatica]